MQADQLCERQHREFILKDSSLSVLMCPWGMEILGSLSHHSDSQRRIIQSQTLCLWGSKVVNAPLVFWVAGKYFRTWNYVPGFFFFFFKCKSLNISLSAFGNSYVRHLPKLTEISNFEIYSFCTLLYYFIPCLFKLFCSTSNRVGRWMHTVCMLYVA